MGICFLVFASHVLSVSPPSAPTPMSLPSKSLLCSTACLVFPLGQVQV